MDNLVVNSRITIPGSELSISFARSGGPGGQNVNKVNTKVILRWTPAESEALTEAVIAGDGLNCWLSLDILRHTTAIRGLGHCYPELAISISEFFSEICQTPCGKLEGGRARRPPVPPKSWQCARSAGASGA